MTSALSTALRLMDRGLVPDAWVRSGIRRLCRERLAKEADGPGLASFAASMREGPVAPVPEKANEQHYELPPEFFRAVLGPRLKYSGCLWEEGASGLARAEVAALRVTCERAGVTDGMRVLELGCGWGSLSLWMAEHYPQGTITAVSNSAPQRRFIEARAAADGLTNLRVVTADMNDFDAGARFDRVVSVEMFEHMRNWGELLERIAGWLAPGGRLFLHVFCHRERAYRFEDEGPSNWMGRHFFTGGIMPARNLIDEFDESLSVVDRWWWNGTHYRKTSEAWLRNLDERREEILPVIEKTYGRSGAKKWLRRWRVFFMACAELFAYGGGEEWGVGHYLLAPSAGRATPPR